MNKYTTNVIALWFQNPIASEVITRATMGLVQVELALDQQIWLSDKRSTDTMENMLNGH